MGQRANIIKKVTETLKEYNGVALDCYTGARRYNLILGVKQVRNGYWIGMLKTKEEADSWVEKFKEKLETSSFANEVLKVERYAYAGQCGIGIIGWGVKVGIKRDPNLR